MNGARERQKSKDEIGPQNSTADVFRRMQQVMVIVPVNADIDVAQDVAEKDGKHGFESLQICSTRNIHVKHHDRDDYCKHAIAECFESTFAHVNSSTQDSEIAVPELAEVPASEEKPPSM